MHYPILLKLAGKKIVVVGGGKVAQRKVETLLDCDADVTVIAPEITPRLEELRRSGAIQASLRRFEPGDTAGSALVISAVDDRSVSELVADECRKSGTIVNVVDKPDLCDFIVPATVRRGPLTIAVSTHGASPAIARRVRERLEGEFNERWGRLLEAASRIRRRCMAEIEDPAKRRAALELLTDDALLDIAEHQDVDALEAEMARSIGLAK